MPAPRWLKGMGLATLALLLVLGLALALGVIWLRTEAGSTHVAQLAASAIGRSIGLELDLGQIALRGRRLAIGPIAVRDPAADSAAAPLAQISAVRLEVDWLRLLVQRGRIRSLVIVEPVIPVPRSTSGALRWPKLGREKVPGAPAPEFPLVRLAVD